MGWRETVTTPILYAVYALLAYGHPAIAASCSLSEAIGVVQLYDLKQETSTFPQEGAILNQFKALLAKVKNPNEAVGAQLDGADNEEFGELRSQFAHIQNYSFTQSNRARDGKVVLDMFNVAQKSYSESNYNDLPPPPTVLAKSPGDAVLYLRIMQPTQITYVPSTDTTCTIDLALSDEQALVLQKINNDIPILQRDKPIIDVLRAKYGVAPGGQLDPSKMISDDAQSLALIQNEIRPVMSNVSLDLDLSNIRAWWAMAQLVYYDDLQDSQIGDNTTDVGETLKAQESTFSPTTLVMFKIWIVIDREVPNDDYTQFQQVQATIRKMTQH